MYGILNKRLNIDKFKMEKNGYQHQDLRWWLTQSVRTQQSVRRQTKSVVMTEWFEPTSCFNMNLFQQIYLSFIYCLYRWMNESMNGFLKKKYDFKYKKNIAKYNQRTKRDKTSDWERTDQKMLSKSYFNPSEFMLVLTILMWVLVLMLMLMLVLVLVLTLVVWHHSDDID